jgi:transcriptional regulator of NAD metabolism
MLKSLFDVEQFMGKLKEEGVKPLSNLTEGVHIHTIEADDSLVMNRIIQALEEKGYLVTQEV